MKWVNMLCIILFQVNNKDNYWSDAIIVGFELIHQLSVLTAEFEQELAWWTKFSFGNFNPFQPTVAFYIETSHLFHSACKRIINN